MMMMMTATLPLPAADERTHETTQPVSWVPQKRSASKRDDERLLLPRVAVLEMQSDFTTLARQLAPRDLFTQDDLVQEMSLAVLLTNDPQTRSAFRMIAAWRARDFLRWLQLIHAKEERVKKTKSVSTEEEQEPSSPELEKVCEAINRITNGNGNY